MFVGKLKFVPIARSDSFTSLLSVDLNALPRLKKMPWIIPELCAFDSDSESVGE